jgi:RND family efflux transporter MFP subunit
VIVLVVGFMFLRKRSAATEVEVVKAQKQEVVKNISASGETKASQELTVKSKVAAKVKEFNVKSGDWVKKDEVILKFDENSLKSAASDALKTYLAAKAAKNSFDSQLSAYKKSVDAEKYSRDQADEDYREDDSPANKEAKKNAEYSYSSAIATYQTLLDKKSSVEQAVTSAYDSYIVTLDNYKATELKAPAEGYVAIYSVEDGDAVIAGQKIFSITNNAALRFVAEVDEADIQNINIDQRTFVQLESFPDKSFEGKVTSIDSKTRVTSSGSTVIDVEIDISPENIKPIIGMTGTAQIRIGKSVDQVAVPFDALVTESDQTYVFVVKSDNTVEKRKVKIGFEGDELYSIIDGLQESENVVVGSNVGQLKNGSKISIAKN